MTLKKIMIPFLGLALSSQLIGCGTPTSQEFTEQPSQEVKESSQIDSIQVEDSIEGNVEAEPNNAPSPSPSLIVIAESTDKRAPTAEELQEIFESVYDYCDIFRDIGLTDKEILEFELADLDVKFNIRAELLKPEDIEEQYKAWRPVVEIPATESTPPEVSATKQPVQNNNTSLTNSNNVPAEDRIDQANIEAGFEADIDPNTGEVNYWNPNTVSEPSNPGLVIDYGGQSGQVRGDPDKAQSAQDAGYLPTKPEDIIYGPSNELPGIILDYGGQSGQVKADPDKTQSAQEAGYLPDDPSNYIYGN